MHVGDAFVPDRRTKCGRHVLPAFDAEHRIVRWNGDESDALRTKCARYADDGPGCADAGHEVGHASTGLLPDLGRGAELVGERVRRVRVLINIDIAVRVGRGTSLRFADRAIRALEWIGEDELRAKGARDALALERYLVGHAELEGVAADGADHSERDAGVAARRVEHDPTATQPAFLLRIEHHPESGPILHAPARIRALDLQPEVASQARADAVQRDERRVADALEDRSAHALANEVGGEAGHSKRLVERARPSPSPARVGRDEALRRSRRSPRRRATSERS